MSNIVTQRERVILALSHKEPDRVPIDLGGSNCSTIHIDAYRKLLKYLGIKDRSTGEPADMIQQVVLNLSEELLERLGVDTRSIYVGAPDNKRGWVKENEFEDEWGIIWRRPKGGYYFDLSYSPFKDIDTIEGIKKYNWPDPDDEGRYRGIREKAKTVSKENKYAIVGNCYIIPYGLGLLMRGFQNFFMDLMVNKRFAEAFMDKVLEIELKIVVNFLKECGEMIDVFCVFEDDYDGQNGALIPPNIFSELVAPRLKKAVAESKKYTKAKIFHHCCGSVYNKIDELAKIGVDIIGPVQVSAKNMGNTKRLKEKFGDKIVFWGAIDTHRVLNHGTASDVKEEVRRRIKDLAPSGGYVAAAVHNIQRDVPPQNIMALFEAVREYGRYPIRL